mmetsp:Transcript_2424/g.6134  ORF Transcript_2424/g.6134 Transcript_2424/m.6134 type:complete len:82 (-) Transcript_2424:869-1114(-)
MATTPNQCAGLSFAKSGNISATGHATGGRSAQHSTWPLACGFFTSAAAAASSAAACRSLHSPDEAEQVADLSASFAARAGF